MRKLMPMALVLLAAALNSGSVLASQSHSGGWKSDDSHDYSHDNSYKSEDKDSKDEEAKNESEDEHEQEADNEYDGYNPDDGLGYKYEQQDSEDHHESDNSYTEDEHETEFEHCMLDDAFHEMDDEEDGDHHYGDHQYGDNEDEHHGPFDPEDCDVKPVPVPAAVWMLGSGIVALGAKRRRRSA